MPEPTIRPTQSWSATLILLIAGLFGAASFYFSDFPIPPEYADAIDPAAWKIQVMIGPAVLAVAAALLGHFFAARTGLGAPVLRAVVKREAALRPLTAQLLWAALGAGVFLAMLASAKPLLAMAGISDEVGALAAFERDNLHIATKFLYGVVAEEIIMRWGLFSLIAYLATLVLARWMSVRASLSVAIIVASLLTTAFHMPTLSEITAEPPEALLLYSAISGFISSAIACELFAKRGLGAAMLFKLFVLTALTLAPRLAY